MAKEPTRTSIELRAEADLNVVTAIDNLAAQMQDALSKTELPVSGENPTPAAYDCFAKIRQAVSNARVFTGDYIGRFSVNPMENRAAQIEAENQQLKARIAQLEKASPNVN